jgi:hypothetical protein
MGLIGLVIASLVNIFLASSALQQELEHVDEVEVQRQRTED